ncbi:MULTISPECIES: D-aminoacylase [unclassified Devosia]|uniref:N-acyl-D-amino-acid deacylase family protein n=1 Tax=unclassified Devosia TaxID=196773 RepID=UPI00145DE259|nr:MULTISPECIES: D-aminoacylase [unclassified Devosia]MBJ6987902.1 D-aminoacylase [Devosia sp. MC521]QMW63804.1 D-aminoacylase [Devosia sp. MC521]
MTLASNNTPDWVFRNARIIDGKGGASYHGELAIVGDTISAVGPVGSISQTGRNEVDLEGLALAPGFIDSHTHDDRIVLDAPEMLPKISQGVTTVVVGNCGVSLAPVTFKGDPPPPMNLLGGNRSYEFVTFASYARAVAEVVPAVNVAALVGHSALRLAVMADVNAKASDSEIERMGALLSEAMENGAVGWSTGLFYPTNAAADADEVSRLGRYVARHSGVYATHMRDEFEHVLESIDESADTAKAAGTALVISHHKCAGVENWGRSQQTLPKITRLAQDQTINIDVYPYAAGSTNLRADLITDTYPIMISWSGPHPEMTGRYLIDIAAEWGLDLSSAAAKLQPAGAIYFQMDEADVRRVLASPLSMIGSDGLPHDVHPHPRLWGTFPRVLGHYARDENLFDLETAVHKMTGKTAKVFGLTRRGQLKAGCFADLVAFRPDAIADLATYEKPVQQSVGIELVMVNGKMSFGQSGASVTRAGRLVYRDR